MRCSNACRLLSAAALTLIAAASSAVEPAPRGAAAAADAADAAIDVDGILGAFAAMPGLEARFTEEKHLALLAAPLKSSGTIYFQPPNLLARHVVTPAASQVVIADGVVRITEASGKQQTIDVASQPAVRAFLGSFADLLAGSRARLEATYALTFTRQAAPQGSWQLALTPRAAPLNQLVSKITVSGSGRAVSQIRVDETAGDYSVITMRAANPARVFDAAEQARLFGAPKPPTP